MVAPEQQPAHESSQQTYEPFDPLATRQASDAEGQLTVHNILKSYHSSYDLFAEAIQNAMDAVHQRWRSDPDAFRPIIFVEIDETADSFTVVDNGVGIEPADCKSVFAPNFSLKTSVLLGPGRRLRGHKGVGATFLAYGFNQTDLASKSAGGILWTGRMVGGRRWAIGQEGAPRPLVSPYTEDSPVLATINRGTLIRIKCGPGTKPATLARIAIGIQAWSAILRTETAIGMLPVGVEERFQPAVTLRVVTSDGSLENQIEPKYLFPHLVFDERRFIDLGAYHRDHERGSPPPAALNKEGIYRTWLKAELEEKLPTLYQGLELDKDPATIDIWAYGFMAYGTKFFEDARTSLGGNQSSKHWVRAGLRLASESMIIGSERQISLQRYTFSQNTCHIIVHVSGIEPDIGRKGFEQGIEDLAQRIAKYAIEDYLVQNREFLRAETGDTSNKQFEEWKFEARTYEGVSPLPSWPGITLRMTSCPRKEQDVVALFNQLLGAGALPGYEVVSTSTHQQYDSLIWARLRWDQLDSAIYDEHVRRWGVERFRAENLAAEPGAVIPLEFKADLYGLLTDFRSDTKRFPGIEIAVAWNAGAPVQRATDFELRELRIPQDLSERIYPGQTHELRSGANADHVIKVILLEELLRQAQSV